MIGFRTRVEMQTGELLRQIDRAERRALRVVGFETYRDAKDSIRPGPAPSAPGQPPRSKLGILKHHIRYAVDGERKLMVSGPEYLPRKSRDVPQSLEQGGISITANGESLRISARPFMRPAFARTLRQVLPRVLTDSVRSGGN